jgi:hypothetical protein
MARAVKPAWQYSQEAKITTIELVIRHLTAQSFDLFTDFFHLGRKVNGHEMNDTLCVQLNLFIFVCHVTQFLQHFLFPFHLAKL